MQFNTDGAKFLFFMFIFQITPRRQLFNRNNNVATLVPLNSTKLNGVNLTTTKHQTTTLHGSNDENLSVESYATFQV